MKKEVILMNRRNFIKNIFFTIFSYSILSNCVRAVSFKPSQNKMNKLLQNHSLIVYKNMNIFTYDGFGINPIMEHLEKQLRCFLYTEMQKMFIHL